MRNRWLEMSDDDLGTICRWDFHKTTGNGGQKKNKTSSAVRVIHLPTEISTVCDDSRSQKMNRKSALHKLRMALALTLREIPATGVDLPSGTLPALTSPAYPIFAAKLLDLLAFYGWEPEKVCSYLQWSKSRFFKILGRDRRLADIVNSERGKSGKTFMHF